MYAWGKMALKGSLNALKSHLKYSYRNEHDAILGGLEILEAIIKNLDSFDIEEEKK